LANIEIVFSFIFFRLYDSVPTMLTQTSWFIYLWTVW